MKITKRDNRWYDKNNNSWSTEELATRYSPTLTNCRECRDCSYCEDCSNCSGCSHCNHLIDKKNYKPQPIKPKKKKSKIRQPLVDHRWYEFLYQRPYAPLL